MSADSDCTSSGSLSQVVLYRSKEHCGIIVANWHIAAHPGNRRYERLNKNMAEQALARMRVLEWCNMAAGPYCTKLLADLGAEVIKVEPPCGGDGSRRQGPFLADIPDSEKSGLFLFLNTSKLGITLDVASPGGKRIFLELLKQADILVMDAQQRQVKKLGLDYTTLRELNRGLILTSITPFGLTGPYKNYKSYPLNTFNAGGEAYMTPAGTPFLDRPPLKLANYASEIMCGISSAGAALCAYFSRLRTGEGQLIDMSKQEALLFLNIDAILRYPHYGAITSRLTRGMPVGGIFRCKDGYIAFSPMRREHWAAFFEILQGPESRKDERLTDLNYLEEHRLELREIAQKFLMRRTKEEIYASPLARECPLGPCYNIEEVVNSPQMQSRGFFVEIDHPVAGKLKYPSAPYKFSETPWKVQHPAPMLGEHNEDVYCRRLGYSKHDLVMLREAGVI